MTVFSTATMEWLTPITPALRRLGQKDCPECKVSVVFIVRLRVKTQNPNI